MMLDKALEEISSKDLQELIDQEFKEGKAVDYKKSFWLLDEKANPDLLRKARLEFLKDASSFANADGGHIVVGMDEDEGKPTEILGIEEVNIDERSNQLDQLLQSWIQPRINTDIRFIPIAGRRKVLIIRVEASTIGPHRVCYDNHGHFYSRNSTGAYHMDTEELRVAFTRSEIVAERVRRFRNGRKELLESDQSPIPTRAGPKLVLHLIPQSAFTTSNSYSLKQLREAAVTACPLSAYVNVTGDSVNLDGILRFVGRDNTGNPSDVRTYLQVFRSGIIEAVNADITYQISGKDTLFWRPQNENYLLESLPKYFELLQKLGLRSPLWVFLTLVDVRNVVFPFIQTAEKRFDRDTVLIPEILAAGPKTESTEIVRKMADMVWNAAGIDRCHSIDANGNWVNLRTIHS